MIPWLDLATFLVPLLCWSFIAYQAGRRKGRQEGEDRITEQVRRDMERLGPPPTRPMPRGPGRTSY